MKAVLFHAPHEPLIVEDRPMPSLAEGDALLQVDLCGVCASDLMAIDGVVTDYSPPVVLGHEVAARVVESRNPRAPVGARVSVNPMITCGECVHCRRGQHKYCPDLYGIGHDIDGAFAEVLVAPEPLVSRGGLLAVPEEVPPERLMFVEPLGCVLEAWAETPRRESVAILGAGPIGLLFVQLARREGLFTIVIEPLAHRRELAERLGADELVCPDDEGYARVKDATDGGADAVVVATEHASAIEGAFKCVRRGGAINFFGLAPKGRTITLELEQLHFQGTVIRASWAFSRRSLDAARELIIEGHIDFSPLVTRRFSLHEANEAIAYARERRGAKAALEPAR